MHLSQAALREDLAQLALAMNYPAALAELLHVVVTVLLRNGADVVGVPSAQAGNCFIDVLRFRLEHSGLAGWISFKWSQAFPGDAARGRVLRPVRELTYADLAARNFDPHATIALVLDYLCGDRSQ